MKTEIYTSRYKDVLSLVMETDGLRAVFLAEHGAKMASLVIKPTGRELLAQAPGEAYKRLAYDGVYVDSECSGFDDMLPTIDPCVYEDDPWAGVRLPDHGEVCALPWRVRLDGDTAVMETYGVRLPYRFTKTIRFMSETALEIAYDLENLCGFDMDFLWAAHTMLNAEEGGRVILPYAPGSEVDLMFSRRLGSRTPVNGWRWPLTETREGMVDFSRTAARSPEGDAYKFYFRDRVPAGRFEYRYATDQTGFIMEFPARYVPYLSLWINEGSFHGLHTLAPEPCTGAYDRPDRAKRAGMNSVLPAGGTYSWYLRFSVSI